jgi:hypothetical protein
MTNALYYGDNLVVLRESIATESVDLIYLDPPFNSNASYNVLFRAPSGEQSQGPRLIGRGSPSMLLGPGTYGRGGRSAHHTCSILNRPCILVVTHCGDVQGLHGICVRLASARGWLNRQRSAPTFRI